jgi:hypothetical protein
VQHYSTKHESHKLLTPATDKQIRNTGKNCYLDKHQNHSWAKKGHSQITTAEHNKRTSPKSERTTDTRQCKVKQTITMNELMQVYTPWQLRMSIRQIHHQNYKDLWFSAKCCYPIQALGFKYHWAILYSMLLDFNFSQFQEFLFTSSTMLSKQISLFWNTFSFLDFQMLQIHADQITPTLLYKTLPPRVRPSNWSKCSKLSFWNVVETPNHIQTTYQIPVKTGHSKKKMRNWFFYIAISHTPKETMINE